VRTKFTIMSSDEDNSSKKEKKFGPKEGIPPYAFQAQTANVANTGVTPFSIGTNLLLSAAGLSQPRTFTWPDVAGNNVLTDQAPQNMSNKNAMASQNFFTELYQSPIVMRTGGFEPHGSATTGGFLDGALAYHNILPTSGITLGFDTTAGLFATMSSGAVAGNNAGIQTVGTNTVGYVARLAFQGGARSVAKVTTTSTTRRIFGFSSNATFPAANTATFLASGDQGVIVGFKETDTYHTIYYNDGNQAMQSQLVTPNIAVTDTGFHDYKIYWSTGGASVNVIVDGVMQTALSSKIPLPTTNLYFTNSVQTSTTSASTMGLHATFFESAK
jgi:hypothetical protein